MSFGEAEMPRARAGPGRSRLGFAQAVEESFVFLVSRYGYRLASAQPTFVRYESGRLFVNVFHGRGSYELGVEIGRRIKVSGRPAEEQFTLREVIALDHDLADVGYRAFTTSQREPLARFVAQLAAWTQEFAQRALEGDSATFAALGDQQARISREMLDGWRAEDLRADAAEAWRKADWDSVISAYTEIDERLETVELKGSERLRLNYARKRLGSPQPRRAPG